MSFKSFHVFHKNSAGGVPGFWDGNRENAGTAAQGGGGKVQLNQIVYIYGGNVGKPLEKPQFSMDNFEKMRYHKYCLVYRSNNFALLKNGQCVA